MHKQFSIVQPKLERHTDKLAHSLTHSLTHQYSRTEIIQDNLNPEWATQIKIEYHFEIVQNLRFEVVSRTRAFVVIVFVVIAIVVVAIVVVIVVVIAVAIYEHFFKRCI